METRLGFEYLTQVHVSEALEETNTEYLCDTVRGITTTLKLKNKKMGKVYIQELNIFFQHRAESKMNIQLHDTQ